MHEKESTGEPSPEDILASLGRQAINFDGGLPYRRPKIMPSVVYEDDGTVTFRSEHKFISHPEATPLSDKPIDPQCN